MPCSSGKAAFASDHEWDPEAMTKDIMDSRIRFTLSQRNWGRLIAIIKRVGMPFNQLQVAEIGCGTGTCSLMLAFLGASVTLIDCNESVLSETEKCFHAYGATGNFVGADCLEAPPAALRGEYHLVMSGGLAEHFAGEDRLRCFRYHRMLLRNNGLACISVPNRFSPFLQPVLAFRRMTGTFGISLELPYTHGELIHIMREAGFRYGFVSGSASVKRDAFIYSAGFVSALVDCLPPSMSSRLRSWKIRLHSSESGQAGDPAETDIKGECLRHMQAIGPSDPFKTDLIIDHFASGLNLFAMT
jgi:SAM-dependent methyltransferase